MERINVAEILKYCPSNMPLDCTMYEDVSFAGVTENLNFPIQIKINVEGNWAKEITLTSEGKFGNHPNAKCIIFPKGRTTWEGFVPPFKFKNGDVMAVENDWGIHIFIYNHTTDEYDGYGYYAILTSIGNFKINSFCSGNTYRLATKEEKEKLFGAIKANGYKWNEETKNLETLVESDFKDGDIVYTIGDSIAILGDKIGEHSERFNSYCGLFNYEFDLDVKVTPERLATEEEKAELFRSIKEHGYKWNEETKNLEALVESDFKDGDILSYQCAGLRNRTIYIYRYHPTMNTSYYVALGGDLDFMVNHKYGYALSGYNTSARLATDAEKVKLFQAIKDKGYNWNIEKKTLEKLKEPKFKDGDIVTNGEFIAIFHKIEWRHTYYHCRYNNHTNNSQFKIDSGIGFIDEYRLANEEEKSILFQAIKEHGYKWDAKTKTLEKLPKFKVGDRIRHKNDKTIIETIGYIYYDSYALCGSHILLFVDQDMWELVPNKFDINTLKPFDKVLVRCSTLEKWRIQFFEKYDETYQYPFICIGCNKYTQCIPYEGNEHLLDKTNDCKEYFNTWE